MRGRSRSAGSAHGIAACSQSLLRFESFRCGRVVDHPIAAAGALDARKKLPRSEQKPDPGSPPRHKSRISVSFRESCHILLNTLYIEFVILQQFNYWMKDHHMGIHIHEYMSFCHSVDVMSLRVKTL